jgi:uncharacterized protein (TIGR03086 family)
MSVEFDLRPSAARLAELVSSVRDDQLALPTPCREYTVGDLLDHIDGLSLAFTWAAKKDFPDGPAEGGSGDASRLGDDWRERIPARLDALGDAWVDPAAWEGMTMAGPVEMPGQIAALVAVDEVVAHAWDLARATGQPFAADDAAVAAATSFAEMFDDDNRGDAFGPPVETAADAAPLDRLIGLLGRNPAWTSPA